MVRYICLIAILQEVFLLIRRQKTTIHLNAMETTKISEVKRMIQGILKYPPEDQMLVKQEQIELEDEKVLSDYNLTAVTARAHLPVLIGLRLRNKGVFNEISEVVDCLF